MNRLSWLSVSRITTCFRHPTPTFSVRNPTSRMFEPIDKAFQQDFYSQFQASRAGSRAFDITSRLFFI